MASIADIGQKVTVRVLPEIWESFCAELAKLNRAGIKIQGHVMTKEALLNSVLAASLGKPLDTRRTEIKSGLATVEAILEASDQAQPEQ